MLKTLSALVTDVEKALYQGAGPSVQTYAQDNIIQQIQNAFDHVFMSDWWPQFIVREFRTLDGLTGQVTTAFTSIRQFDDIKYVRRQNSPRPIPTLPLETDIFRLQSGTTARYIEPTADTKLFRVYPATATDQLLIIGRARPTTEFAMNSIVPFDNVALTHYAAWSYYTDDGSNPASADKHRGLFESRISDLKDAAFGSVILLDGPNSAAVPDQWYEQP